MARLVEQKGIKLIREILPQLMALGVQRIIFGQGEQHYIDCFTECSRRWPDQRGRVCDGQFRPSYGHGHGKNQL